MLKYSVAYREWRFRGPLWSEYHNFSNNVSQEYRWHVDRFTMTK